MVIYAQFCNTIRHDANEGIPSLDLIDGIISIGGGALLVGVGIAGAAAATTAIVGVGAVAIIIAGEYYIIRGIAGMMKNYL